MNGAGKSIVIDSIRAILSTQKLERNIVVNDKDFCVEIDAEYDKNGVKHLSVSQLQNGHFSYVDYSNLNKFFQLGYELLGKVYNWEVDFWSSKLPSDTFEIKNMMSIKHQMVLKDVLLGKKSDMDLTNFIWVFRYLV